jgi:AcrR family transcriptional regulator
MTQKSASLHAKATIGTPSVSNGHADPVEGRRLILDAAARLFRNEGYASTSLRDIAAACDVTTGSIYHHFDSKEEIVSEVLRIGVERVAEEVRRAVTALDPASDAQTILHAAVYAHLRGLLELQDYTSANVRIFGQVPPSIRAKHIVTRNAYEAYWHKLLLRCAVQGGFDPARNLKLTRLFLINALNGSLEWYKPSITSTQALAHELTELFLHGLIQASDLNTRQRAAATKTSQRK